MTNGKHHALVRPPGGLCALPRSKVPRLRVGFVFSKSGQPQAGGCGPQRFGFVFSGPAITSRQYRTRVPASFFQVRHPQAGGRGPQRFGFVFSGPTTQAGSIAPESWLRFFRSVICGQAAAARRCETGLRTMRRKRTANVSCALRKRTANASCALNKRRRAYQPVRSPRSIGRTSGEHREKSCSRLRWAPPRWDEDGSRLKRISRNDRSPKFF